MRVASRITSRVILTDFQISTPFNFILLAIEVIVLRVAQEVGIIPALGPDGPLGSWGMFIIIGIMGLVIFPLNLAIIAIIAAAYRKLRRRISN
jgi:hypothetical protein